MKIRFRARNLNGFAKDSALVKHAINPMSSSALIIDHYKKTLNRDSTSSSKPITNQRQRKLLNLAQEDLHKPMTKSIKKNQANCM